MTREELNLMCDDLGLSYYWNPVINNKKVGGLHFKVNEYRFHFSIDWEKQEITISYNLCDTLKIGRDKKGVYSLNIANIEELLNAIKSYSNVYYPVLSDKISN